MGDTATAQHEYELLTFYRHGPEYGVSCYETGTELLFPDGIVVNTNRASGTIEFDSYQGDDATVTALGSVAVGDGDGRYFGYVTGSNTTTIWDNTPTSSTRTSYIKSFKGLLITAAEPQLRGVYSLTMNQDWSNIPFLTVDDEAI